MSIFKRIYGRRIPATKMDAENPTVGGDAETPAAVTVTTEDPTKPSTETTTTDTDKATNTEPATQPTNGDVSTTAATPTAATTNGAPRSFQFGAKAKMFRDMIAQHRIKLDSDQTQLLVIIGMITLAVLCSLVAIGTNYWQCQGDQHYGLWNTCQKQTALTLPELTNNTTDANTTTFSSGNI